MAGLTIDKVSGDLVRLATTDAMHFNGDGQLAGIDDETDSPSFEDEMLKAMDAVNADQQTSSALSQQMITDPDSVDAHDVTIAMAKANLSLNIAKTVLNRIVTAWKDVINTR
jgi:flagellar hook-basal body complex protein FliE